MQPAWVAWLVSGVLALFGGWIVITNYWITIRWYRHRRTASHTPLLGGLCLMAAMLASPIPRVARYAWGPLVIDVGWLRMVVRCLCVGVWVQRLKEGRAG